MKNKKCLFSCSQAFTVKGLNANRFNNNKFIILIYIYIYIYILTLIDRQLDRQIDRYIGRYIDR